MRLVQTQVSLSMLLASCVTVGGLGVRAKGENAARSCDANGPREHQPQREACPDAPSLENIPKQGEQDQELS